MRLAFWKDVFLSEFGFDDSFRIRLTIPLAFQKDVKPLVFKWLKKYYV